MSARFFFSIILLLVIYACKTEYRVLNDVLFQDTVVLKGCEPVINELTYIDELIVCNDYAVIKNNREDSVFMVYRLPDFNIVNAFGNKGRGAGEYLVPKIVKKQDSCLWVYDFGVNKLMQVDIHTGERNDCRMSLPAKDWPQEVLFMQDTCFVYENFKQEAGEIVKYDSERTVLYDFADLKKRIRDPQGFRGFIGMNATTGDIVYAYQYIRRFDILDINGNIKSINLYPDTEYPLIETDKLDYQNSVTYYFDVTTTEDRIYLYYAGKPGSEIGKNYKFDTYIEEYDWEGNPVKKYAIDQFVKSVRFYKGKFVCVSLSSEVPFLFYQ